LKRLDEYWYQKNLISLLLLPLSVIFCSLSWLRRKCYRVGLLKSEQMPVPVVIVGNITVGGSGKTPLIISMIQLLKQAGYSPGVISRGYGGTARTWPQQVRKDSDPRVVGDEPLLIATRSNVPISVGPDRVAAAKKLLEFHQCDVILSDDGLQHYALARDIEIVVVDGIRRFGNGYCLPAGPLREKEKRLQEVDMIVANGLALRREFPMDLRVIMLVNLKTGDTCELDNFKPKHVHAVAGIGYPARFFTTLRKQGFEIEEHSFPDHFNYAINDLDFNDELPIIMTEKDAVKCRLFASDNMWYLPVQAHLNENFMTRLLYLLKDCNTERVNHSEA